MYSRLQLYMQIHTITMPPACVLCDAIIIHSYLSVSLIQYSSFFLIHLNNSNKNLFYDFSEELLNGACWGLSLQTCLDHIDFPNNWISLCIWCRESFHLCIFFKAIFGVFFFIFKNLRSVLNPAGAFRIQCFNLPLGKGHVYVCTCVRSLVPMK